MVNNNYFGPIYTAIVSDAYREIADLVCRDARNFYRTFPGKLRENASLKWRISIPLFSLDQKYWEESDKDPDTRFTSRYLIAKRYAQEFPQKADTVLGFCELFSAVNLMRQACAATAPAAAKDFVETFCRLCETAPDQNDVDLLIAFIKEEHVAKRNILTAIDKIPADAKTGINLHIREHIQSLSAAWEQVPFRER